MRKLLGISLRNLLRYRRRSVFTASLIVIGVVFVLSFISVSGSFKRMIIGQITDSMMGHIQVHRSGYTAAIDNLPLYLNIDEEKANYLEEVLSSEKGVESYSMRLKLGGLISNYAETTNLRINGIDPEKEFATVPLLTSRIVEGPRTLKEGGILVPILLAKGMKLKIGNPVVVVTTNVDGSVNAKQLTVSGILENVVGPLGRDGYIHIKDAAELLRMEKPQVSEVAVRLRSYDDLQRVEEAIVGQLSTIKDPKKKSGHFFEIHNWADLHPFANIAKMIDLMTLFTTLMLVGIVLISILNVMTTAVYERMREIGTMIAIGTLPWKISLMFLFEGLFLGVGGVVAGSAVSAALLTVLQMMKLKFSFGRMEGLILSPEMKIIDFVAVSALVIAVSAVAGLQPAIKASRLDPVKAFRQM